MTEPQNSAPHYRSYVQTGVDYLNTLPAHWEINKGKWLFRKEDRPVSDLDEVVTCFRNGQVTLRKNRRTDGFTNALHEHGYQGIRKGDLVIHAMDAFAGAVGVSDADGKSSPVYSACTPKAANSVSSYYFAYFMRDLASTGYLLSLAKGIRERSTDFRFKDFSVLELPVPPISEQLAIVDYLNKKTNQIDETISVKEQQITLLKERKQILIQNAVTRGLNSNAPMRDSGVEWIGEIPAHWQLKRLKYVLDERNERSQTGEEPLLMVSQKHGLVVRSEYHEKAEVALSKIDNKIVHQNDLVFNKLKAHLGVFFKSSITFKGIVSPDYAVYTLKDFIEDAKFLEHLFRHPAYIGQFIVRATGIVEGLIRLYTTELFEMPIPIAPIEEQREILKFIETNSTKIDGACALLERQITKLKEYKATLINSAVTGKIKVPGVVEPTHVANQLDAREACL
ncbi:restriction endonuclease subunit S [Marinobacter sediminicola]|uniref:restriction endonuclease subunit S n=1 Tax=Marinobacter sediminicola TaxID=3072994 RepID=UPI002811A5AD|nr:restriction endonuclease subunit S [Marinobacter sp. F26243]